MGHIQPTNPAPKYTFTPHDLEVIAFQVIIAMLIAGISYITKLNFGVYTPLIYPLLMALGEALRRYIV